MVNYKDLEKKFFSVSEKVTGEIYKKEWIEYLKNDKYSIHADNIKKLKRLISQERQLKREQLLELCKKILNSKNQELKNNIAEFKEFYESYYSVDLQNIANRQTNEIQKNIICKAIEKIKATK